jgi:hypothetical protein
MTLLEDMAAHDIVTLFSSCSIATSELGRDLPGVLILRLSKIRPYVQEKVMTKLYKFT